MGDFVGGIMSYFMQPQVEEGGQKKVIVQEITEKELLLKILIELKKMNVYLQELSEIEVNDNVITMN